jgi:hypothetical protein
MWKAGSDDSPQYCKLSTETVNSKSVKKAKKKNWAIVTGS